MQSAGTRTLGRMSSSPWPNIVTLVRVALAPPLVAAGLAGERGWFAGLLTVALLTDVIDGWLARWLQAYSELGRKLDSLADYLTLFAGLTGIWLLWPEVIRREWMWFAAVLTSFFGAMLFCYVRLGRVPCYHSWASKATVVACVVALVPLLAGWTPVPARIVATFQVLVGVEEVAIALLVPWHDGEVPSLWHAWRMRRRRVDTAVQVSA